MLQTITPKGKRHPYLKRWRRRLRFRETPSERKVALALTREGTKFSKQQVFHCDVTNRSFIADFWLWEHRTIIEVDGSHHREEPYRSADKKRDAMFAASGIRTVRVQNGDVDKWTGCP